MSFSLSAEGVRAVVLDIEGTTTPISFVYGVLFPFARAHLTRYLTQHASSEATRHTVAMLREEHAADMNRSAGPPPWAEESTLPTAQVASIAAYVHWLMDRDRKSTALKSLQGQIWEAGYRAGHLRGQVFADVPGALERWRAQDLEICIFSSGSVLAQRLLFGYCETGDLTKFLSGYFDTTVGPKADRHSYTRISQLIGRAARDILFVSDVTAELDAACAAGLKTLLCVRPSNPAQPADHRHGIIRSFDEIVG